MNWLFFSIVLGIWFSGWVSNGSSCVSRICSGVSWLLIFFMICVYCCCCCMVIWKCWC